MPDRDGKLSEAEKKKLADWLSSKGPPPTCPICSSSQWAIGDHLVQPVTLGPARAPQLGGYAYPQAMVISTTCGYTMYINAVLAGLVEVRPTQGIPTASAR